MSLLRIQTALMSAADSLYRIIPRKTPSVSEFRDFAVISHRGQHDNVDVFENTLEAFRQVGPSGAVGIEFDIQWTKDFEPVVFHDKSLLRVFGENRLVSDFQFPDLKKHFPQIPHFADVVQDFGHLHLMVELKDGDLDWDHCQKKIRDVLKAKRDQESFHLMSLTPHVFEHFREVPKSRFLTIGKGNIVEMSEMALKNGWGGVTGHYLLISQKMIDRHHKAGQLVGVGFPASLNSLFREYSRGVDFIYTNHALELSLDFSSHLHQR